MKGALACCLIASAPFVITAVCHAQPAPAPPIVPTGGSPGIGTGPGIDAAEPNLSPAAATIFLCPGVGGAANVVGFGGGYCDFDFTPVPLGNRTFGVMHVHCEWGGGTPIVEMWNCWRVFPGQPDHPAHPDPDIIPDGMGVPWAIQGPTPTDQWPPPGLAPASAFAPPPPPTEPAPMEPTGPPPGPPPEPR